MRGGWQIDNGRDGARTSVGAIIVWLQIHAAVRLKPNSILIEQIQTADFYRSCRSLVSGPVWIHCAPENEWFRLKAFTTLMAIIYVFIDPTVQVEREQCLTLFNISIFSLKLESVIL